MVPVVVRRLYIYIYILAIVALYICVVLLLCAGMIQPISSLLLLFALLLLLLRVVVVVVGVVDVDTNVLAGVVAIVVVHAIRV